VLATCVTAAEVAARLPVLRPLGAALLVILITALVASLGVIPTGPAGSPVSDGVCDALAQLAISLLLLQVELASVARAGAPRLVGSLGSASGTCLGLGLVERLSS